MEEAVGYWAFIYIYLFFFFFFFWYCGLNSGPSSYQAEAVPLDYILALKSDTL